MCGRFWRAFGDIGGADVFGYPIRKTEVDATRGGLRVQWFENGRFELRPRNDRPNDVQLANVGEERLAQLAVDWRTSVRSEFLPEGGAIAACRWFDVAGTPRGIRHNVCNDAVDPVTGAKGSVGFATFYDARGDSAPRSLGNPISAAYKRRSDRRLGAVVRARAPRVAPRERRPGGHRAGRAARRRAPRRVTPSQYASTCFEITTR